MCYDKKDPIIIGSDHAAFQLKEKIISFIKSVGINVKDAGTFSEESTNYVDYAKKVVSELRAKGIRAMVDSRNERMNAKIRDAQNKKIPYMLVVGDKEVAGEAVSVRLRSGEDLGRKAVAEFRALARAAVESKG